MRDLLGTGILFMMFVTGTALAIRPYWGVGQAHGAVRPNARCQAANVLAHNARIAGIMSFGGLVTGGALAVMSTVKAGYGLGDAAGKAYARGFSARRLWALTWPHLLLELPGFLAAGVAGLRGGVLVARLITGPTNAAVLCVVRSMALLALSLLLLGAASCIECHVTPGR
jgi:uncharacterized membrane protein SpoIIM required for sporulation